MKRKVIKIGSSLGITVPASLLAKISALKGSEVEVSYNPRRDVLEVAGLEVITGQPDELLIKVNKLSRKYAAELKKLENG